MLSGQTHILFDPVRPQSSAGFFFDGPSTSTSNTFPKSRLLLSRDNLFWSEISSSSLRVLTSVGTSSG